MKQAIVLKKTLEPIFESYASETITDVAIVLRIDGSLGSFGPEGIENIELNNGKISCDLVIRDHGWKNLGVAEIRSILKNGILNAISECFVRINENQELSEIQKVLSNDS